MKAMTARLVVAAIVIAPVVGRGFSPGGIAAQFRTTSEIVPVYAARRP